MSGQHLWDFQNFLLLEIPKNHKATKPYFESWGDFLAAKDWASAVALLTISTTNPDAATIIENNFAANPLFTAWSAYQFLLTTKFHMLLAAI